MQEYSSSSYCKVSFDACLEYAFTSYTHSPMTHIYELLVRFLYPYSTSRVKYHGGRPTKTKTDEREYSRKQSKSIVTCRRAIFSINKYLSVIDYEYETSRAVSLTVSIDPL